MPDKPYCYAYPRPRVSVDAVVISPGPDGAQVLLIRRANPPFQGMWALPGGFVEMDEDLDAAAARELAEETGVAGVRLEQFRTFGAPGRDPRTRTISVAHIGVADARAHPPAAGDDAAEAAWHRVDALPPLAYDHAEIIAAALERLDKEPLK